MSGVAALKQNKVVAELHIIKAFRQTEVGLLPEDWTCTSVGEAFEICDNLRLPLSRSIRERMSGPYPYYGPTSVQGWINEYRLEGTFALIGEDGDHFLKWRTSPMTLLVDGRFNVNNHAHVVHGSTNHTAWFYWFFLNRDLTAHLTRQGASRYKLTKANLVKLPCALPPPPEQKAIATALSDADALVERLESLIAKKRAIKEGAMQELLTGKRRLPGFKGKWELKQLADVADIDPESIGSNISPDYRFKYISLEDVDLGSLRGYSEQILRSAPSRARRKIRWDDILVATVRPNLKSHLLFGETNGEWICSTGFCVVRCREGVAHTGFVFAHLFSTNIGRQIETLLTGSNYPAINSGDVRALRIPMPNFDEQAAIGVTLSDMDAEIVSFETKLTKARQIKQGMMQELLTGRIRLV